MHHNARNVEILGDRSNISSLLRDCRLDFALTTNRGPGSACKKLKKRGGIAAIAKDHFTLLLVVED